MNKVKINYSKVREEQINAFPIKLIGLAKEANHSLIIYNSNKSVVPEELALRLLKTNYKDYWKFMIKPISFDSYLIVGIVIGYPKNKTYNYDGYYVNKFIGDMPLYIGLNGKPIHQQASKDFFKKIAENRDMRRRYGYEL